MGLTLYNVELLRGDGGTFYMVWIQEVQPTRFARFRLHVPLTHGNLLRVLDDGIWTEYAKKYIDQAVRIETDGAKEYPGPRGPRSGGTSQEDNGTEDDANKRSRWKKPTGQSVETRSRTRSSRAKSDL
jgi:hypothetical protein